MAANPQEDSVTLVRLQLVESDLNKTLSSIRLVKTELNSIGGSVTTTNGLAANINAQNTAAKQLASTWDDVATARLAAETPQTSTNYQLDAEAQRVRALCDAWDEAANKRLTYGDEGTASGGGGLLDALSNARTGSVLGRIGSFGRALPSVQLGGGLSTDAISNVTRLLGVFEVLTGGIGSLLAVAAPLALAAGAVAISLNEQREAEEKAAKAAEQYIEQLKIEADIRSQV